VVVAHCLSGSSRGGTRDPSPSPYSPPGTAVSDDMTDTTVGLMHGSRKGSMLTAMSCPQSLPTRLPSPRRTLCLFSLSMVNETLSSRPSAPLRTISNCDRGELVISLRQEEARR
jgi:hypothetical protein